MNSVNASIMRNDESGRKLMQDILTRVREVNYFPKEIVKSLIEFRVDGKRLGRVRPAMAEKLCSIGNVFQLVPNNDTENKQPFILSFTESAGYTYESRTQAVSTVTQQLYEEGIVTGWRDELYPISPSFYHDPVFAMERVTVPFLGATEYGVHVNGLVVQENKENSERELQMWMARRSRTKSKYPGMLDHVAAGGQPVGLSLSENVLKECYEEAGIPPALASQGLRPAGAISYARYIASKDVIEDVVLFNYDLYLPSEFQPQVVDGEVEEFFLWSIEELLASMALDFHDPIKPNCYSVIIDFLQRHGYLNPEVPGYLDVINELRSGSCR
jgi:8-oxo-dGTP pyrophosphatase MutT (NUDIX family)